MTKDKFLEMGIALIFLEQKEGRKVYVSNYPETLNISWLGPGGTASRGTASRATT